MSAATIIYRTHNVPHLQAVKERREMERIQTPASVMLRRSGAGHGADVNAVIDNLGAGGFYVRLMQRIEPGTRLNALIKFASAPGESKGAARLAVRGRVLRVENLSGGAYGVAVEIRKYKFV